MKRKSFILLSSICLLVIVYSSYHLVKLGFAENYQTNTGSFDYYILASEHAKEIVKVAPSSITRYEYTFGDNGPIKETLYFKTTPDSTLKEKITQHLTTKNFITAKSDFVFLDSTQETEIHIELESIDIYSY